MRRFFLASPVYLLLSMVALPASAVPLTLTYEGFVSTDTVTGGGLVGSTLRMTFVYETSTPDSNGSTTNGTYDGALLSATFSVDGNTWSFATPNFGEVGVRTGPLSDLFGIDTASTVSAVFTAPTLGGQTLTDGILIFTSAAGSVFSNDRLPVSPPNPDNFNIATFLTLNFSGGGQVQANNAQLVSEPLTGSLLVLAGAALVARRRHDRRGGLCSHR